MRGSISLDFILTLVIIIAGTASLFFLAYAQIENSVLVATQYKAEAMAMTIGSSINHFAAIGPEGNSHLDLQFNGFIPPDSSVAGEMGFALYMDDSDCTVSIETNQQIYDPAIDGIRVVNQVIITVTPHRLDSTVADTIVAKYPLTTLYADGDIVTVFCNETIGITTATGELWPEVIEL